MFHPTETITTIFKENGCSKNVRQYSYVAVLCRKSGSEVMAVRYEYYERKTDVHNKIVKDFPEWKVKTISRLYDADFI